MRSLDAVALVSNSDLHSPSQTRDVNANVFFGEPDYFAMLDGLRRKDRAICGGTIDLFPEEGKYHLDGPPGVRVQLCTGREACGAATGVRSATSR